MSLFCESYGGKYCPAVANAIVKNNQQNPAVLLNLQSIGIGDGWTDPYAQYPGYYEFAKAKGLINSLEQVCVCVCVYVGEQRLQRLFRFRIRLIDTVMSQ